MEQQNTETIEQTSSKWMVLRVQSRSEKKVARYLNAIQVDDFEHCILADPFTAKVRRKWSDRYKIVEVPIINGYVFFQFHPDCTDHQKRQLLIKLHYIPGVSRILVRPGMSSYDISAPVIVPESQIDILRHLVEEAGASLEPTEEEMAKIKKGRKVVFREGVLADMGVQFLVDDMRKSQPTLYINSGIFLNAHVLVSKQQLKVVEKQPLSTSNPSNCSNFSQLSTLNSQLSTETIRDRSRF